MTTIKNPKSRLMPKVGFQQLLTRIRHAGYTVNKVNNGYNVTLDDQTMLTAMQGYNGYLVRYNTEFLTP